MKKISNEIDFEFGYSIDKYLNNHIDRNTDEKIKRLNYKIAIIRAYCYTLSNSYMHIGNNCYYSDLARRLLNILCERKHQDKCVYWNLHKEDYISQKLRIFIT